MRTRATIVWIGYLAFLAFVLWRSGDADPLGFDGPLPVVKAVVWLAWLAFLVYSVWCSRTEDLLRSVRSLVELHWGRQVGIDLYLGLGVALLLITLHGGVGALVLWVVPVLLFANLAVLFYVAVHFDGIVAAFGL